MQHGLGVVTALLVALSCGPSAQPDNCGEDPDFEVTVRSETGSLPVTTVVEVTFGGGSVETYSPAVTQRPIVLFCDVSHCAPNGAGGTDGQAGETASTSSGIATGGASSSDEPGSAGGAADDASTIESITCKLWTRGPAKVIARTDEWEDMLELKHEEGTCTVTDEIVLGPMSAPAMH